MSRNTYARRRDAVAQSLGHEGVAVIPAAVHAHRNADSEYEYRQDSDFYYLTGFNEPEAVLVIAPGKPKRDVLFLRPRDRAKEIWNGKRAGIEGAVAEYGFAEAFPIDELETRLPELLVGASALHYGVGRNEAMDRRVLKALEAARYAVRRGGTAPDAMIEPAKIVHEMRVRKTEDELAIMRRAAAATKAGHEAGMRATRPGMYEYELQAIIEFQYRMAGASGVAYTSIVAGGANTTILHYNTNRERLEDGALVLVDSGSEFDLYASDVTRTWPVNGRFSPEQRAIYDIVLRAQKAAIDEVRVGRPYDAYHETALRVLTEGLIDVGLIHETLSVALEKKSYEDFYPHRTGHWLGLDVHDAGRYKAGDVYRPLEPGMVLTVEPGLYVQPDLNVDERWKGIGVRIEDDIAVTASDPENLTAAIPKEIEELEAIVGSEGLVAAG